jgi:hypothetical protein
MIFGPWSGVVSGAVAVGSPVGMAMGLLLVGLLAGTTVALVLGAEPRPRRQLAVIALRPPTDGRAAAA